MDTNDEFNVHSSLSKEYNSEFSVGECWGYQKFIKLGDIFDSCYYNEREDSVILRYHVRPTTYLQKCSQLELYIQELESTQECNSNQVFSEVDLDEDESDVPLDNLELRVSSELIESQETVVNSPLLISGKEMLQQINDIEHMVELTLLDDSSS